MRKLKLQKIKNHPDLTTLSIALLACWLMASALSAQDSAEIADPTAEPDVTELSDASGGNSVQDANMRYIAGERYLKQAEKALEKAKEVSPEKREKLMRRVVSAYERAGQEFLGAIQLYKEHPDAYVALGDVWRQTGQVERSLQAYEAALVVVPNDPRAFEGRARAFIALGLFPEATAAYRALAERDAERAAGLVADMRRWAEEHGASETPAEAEMAVELEGWIAGLESEAGSE